MKRPRLLDLFCGAGGCSIGYHRAGFDVIGIDIKPQPRYPFEMFVQDAIDDTLDWRQFDAVHASPPCQAFTSMRNLGKTAARDAPDLVAPVRALLQASGLPYIIENVPGAPLEWPTLLCGSTFGLRVRRHRIFETNWLLFGQPCRHKEGGVVPVWGDGLPSRQEARKARRPIGVYGDHMDPSDKGENHRINRARTLEEAREAMGIDWMNWKELTQSIPPAYTEYIGQQLIRVLENNLRIPK